ncbi:DUF177 domain-containing protein [soil metagenome]
MKRPPLTEMSRPLQVDRIAPGGSSETLSATPAECRLLEKRFGLSALHHLDAVIDLSRWRGNGVKAVGTVSAGIEQVCVVSLEPFTSEMREPIERYFLPRSAAPPTLEQSIEQADVDVFDHGIIDLGEMVCEIVALALDPYPRRPGIAFDGPGEGDAAEGIEAPVSPFAALKALGKRRT